MRYSLSEGLVRLCSRRHYLGRLLLPFMLLSVVSLCELANAHGTHTHKVDIGDAATHPYPTGHSAPEMSSALYKSLTATILVGLAPVLCVGLIPSDKRYLKVLLGFAAGGLLGDVFLHLIPHGLELYESEHSSDSGHSHEHGAATALGLRIVVGFVVFLILQKLFDEFSSSKCAHSHSECGRSGKSAVVLLSILADLAHNFTDGLTLAASFLVSTRMGVTQTVAIVMHELPHEIGDYAILVENGTSKRNAMFIQIATAFGCVLGCVLGFVFELSSVGTAWILPFTAGGFLYIACVQVVPSLVEEKFGLWLSALHVLAIAAGIGLMLAVGYIEEHSDTFAELIFNNALRGSFDAHNEL